MQRADVINTPPESEQNYGSNSTKIIFLGAELIELKIVKLFVYLKKHVKYSFLYKFCLD